MSSEKRDPQSSLGAVKFLRMQARAAKANAEHPENADSPSTISWWNREAQKFNQWASEVEELEYRMIGLEK